MTTPKKRNLIVLSVVILIVAIVLSSFVYLNSQKSYKGPIESLVFGDLHTDSSELIYVAQDQHYFEANGINLTMKNYATGTEITSALTTNQINIGTSGEFPFVNSVLAKQNLSTIASMDRFEAFYLIGRKDHGIQNTLDLRGKTIGVRSQSLGEFYLGRFLDLNGMNIHDITLKDTLPSQWVDSITNGTLDAIVVSQLYVADIQGKLSNNIEIWPVQNQQLAYGLVYASTNWISENPELVSRFLHSLVQAEDYLISNPENAKNTLKNHLSYSDAYLAQVWPNHRFSLTLDQSLILAMQDEAQWLISNRLTNAISTPNFLNYVYPNGLEVVKPESVNIID